MANREVLQDLTDFFVDDDSIGHRLADFLRNRRGEVRNCDMVMANEEISHLAPDLQWERVEESQHQSIHIINNNDSLKESNTQREMLPNSVPTEMKTPAHSLRSRSTVCPLIKGSPKSQNLRRISLLRLTNLKNNSRLTTISNDSKSETELNFKPNIFSTPICDLKKLPTGIRRSLETDSIKIISPELKENDNDLNRKTLILSNKQSRETNVINQDRILGNIEKYTVNGENAIHQDNQKNDKSIQKVKKEFIIEDEIDVRNVIEVETTIIKGGNSNVNKEIPITLVEENQQKNAIMLNSSELSVKSILDVDVDNVMDQDEPIDSNIVNEISSSLIASKSLQADILPTIDKNVSVLEEMQHKEACPVVENDILEEALIEMNACGSTNENNEFQNYDKSVFLNQEHVGSKNMTVRPLTSPIRSNLSINNDISKSAHIILPTLEEGHPEEHQNLNKNDKEHSTPYEEIPENELHVLKTTLLDDMDKDVPDKTSNVATEIVNDNNSLFVDEGTINTEKNCINDDKSSSIKDIANSYSRSQVIEENYNQSSGCERPLNLVCYIEENNVSQKAINASITSNRPSNNAINLIRKHTTNSQKIVPLNKAPGIPLNGEKFAYELGRMSYKEILDLRKHHKSLDLDGDSKEIKVIEDDNFIKRNPKFMGNDSRKRSYNEIRNGIGPTINDESRTPKRPRTVVSSSKRKRNCSLQNVQNRIHGVQNVSFKKNVEQSTESLSDNNNESSNTVVNIADRSKESITKSGEINLDKTMNGKSETWMKSIIPAPAGFQDVTSADMTKKVSLTSMIGKKGKINNTPKDLKKYRMASKSVKEKSLQNKSIVSKKRSLYSYTPEKSLTNNKTSQDVPEIDIDNNILNTEFNRPNLDKHPLSHSIISQNLQTEVISRLTKDTVNSEQNVNDVESKVVSQGNCGAFEIEIPFKKRTCNLKDFVIEKDKDSEIISEPEISLETNTKKSAEKNLRDGNCKQSFSKENTKRDNAFDVIESGHNSQTNEEILSKRKQKRRNNNENLAKEKDRQDRVNSDTTQSEIVHRANHELSPKVSRRKQRNSHKRKNESAEEIGYSIQSEINIKNGNKLSVKRKKTLRKVDDNLPQVFNQEKLKVSTSEDERYDSERMSIDCNLRRSKRSRKIEPPILNNYFCHLYENILFRRNAKKSLNIRESSDYSPIITSIKKQRKQEKQLEKDRDSDYNKDKNVLNKSLTSCDLMQLRSENVTLDSNVASKSKKTNAGLQIKENNFSVNQNVDSIPTTNSDKVQKVSKKRAKKKVNTSSRDKRISSSKSISISLCSEQNESVNSSDLHSILPTPNTNIRSNERRSHLDTVIEEENVNFSANKISLETSSNNLIKCRVVSNRGNTASQVTRQKNEKKTRTKKGKKVVKSIRNDDQAESHSLHIDLQQLPSLEQFNSAFDHLRRQRYDLMTSAMVGINDQNIKSQLPLYPSKSTSPAVGTSKPTTSKCSKLKVVIKKISPQYMRAVMDNNSIKQVDINSLKANTEFYSSNLKKTSAGSQNFGESIESVLDTMTKWLKTLKDRNKNVPILNEVKISPGSQLKYLQFEGMDYAFYKGDKGQSIGYLLFKAKQIKCERCAKYSERHLIPLLGNFLITINKTPITVQTGQLQCIHKGDFYEIQNINNAMSVLLIMKKD